ncbi:alpha/beta fold hydrolase [Shewanella surugensis]|uniref:Alpha/beta hydrolase n=1 Tax=Shewanella surugensis TaxID=212020 RepID=A0ABT0LLG7_9GAMM|nr:alpha/beta hydrolase [Shewanella surugensis]MCL1128001.1 alpha/beta hydrolase [Shewanella surugensis]
MQYYGSIVDSVSAMDYINALSGANGDSIKQIMLNRQISSNIREEDKQMLYRVNANFSCQIGAAIVASTLYDDFRDVFPRITLPTLIISGAASLTPISSQKWLHRQIQY